MVSVLAWQMVSVLWPRRWNWLCLSIVVHAWRRVVVETRGGMDLPGDGLDEPGDGSVVLVVLALVWVMVSVLAW